MKIFQIKYNTIKIFRIKYNIIKAINKNNIYIILKKNKYQFFYTINSYD